MIYDMVTADLQGRVRVYVAPGVPALVRVAGANYYWTSISWHSVRGRPVMLVAAARPTVPGEPPLPAYDAAVALLVPSTVIGTWSSSSIDSTVFAPADDPLSGDEGLELAVHSLGGGPTHVDLALEWAST